MQQVTVIGGGVIGLTSAWWLLEAGYGVTLLERETDVGSGASLRNGGQLSYRYVAPLADAGVPLKALQWLCEENGPLRFRPDIGDTGDSSPVAMDTLFPAVRATVEALATWTAAAALTAMPAGLANTSCGSDNSGKSPDPPRMAAFCRSIAPAIADCCPASWALAPCAMAASAASCSCAAVSRGATPPMSFASGVALVLASVVSNMPLTARATPQALVASSQPSPPPCWRPEWFSMRVI